MRYHLLLLLLFICLHIDGFSQVVEKSNSNSTRVNAQPAAILDNKFRHRYERLFAVGDSHSLFFDQAGIMKSHWTGPIHTATIYQMLKLGLNFDRLQEELAISAHYTNIGPPLWQCPSGKYDVPNIKKGDCVIFCFGFNDIQKNIHKYASNRSEDEIDWLLTQYILLLKEYESKYQITCIPLSIPPNPSPCDEGAMGQFSFGINGDFSTSGTSEERNAYTQYANKMFKILCNEYDLQFLDIYNEISDANGFLKKEYTTDYVHLQWNNEYLVKTLSDAVYTIMITVEESKTYSH